MKIPCKVSLKTMNLKKRNGYQNKGWAAVVDETPERAHHHSTPPQQDPSHTCHGPDPVRLGRRERGYVPELRHPFPLACCHPPQGFRA